MSDTTSEKPVKPRLWRRRRFWLVLTLLLTPALLFGLFKHFTSPQRVADIARTALEKMTGQRVLVGTSELSLGGRITLYDVSIRSSRLPPQNDQLFRARQIDIDQPLLSLVFSGFKPQRVTIYEPVAYFTENLDTGELHHISLAPRDKEKPRQAVTQMPEVFIIGGQARFSEFDQNSQRQLDTIALSGHLINDPSQQAGFNFELRQEDAPAPTRPVIRGEFNLLEKTLRAQIDDLDFDTPHRNALPSQLRNWWEKLDPRGVVRRFEITYGPDEANGLKAVLDLQDAELTLPYGRLAYRMTQVSGRFVVDNKRIDIHDLIGQIEGIHYELNGRVDGLNPHAPFRLQMKVMNFNVPQNPDWLPALPPPVLKHFRRFMPSGVFDAVAIVSRDASGHIEYDGTVRVANASGQYQKFPYPIGHVQGRVNFNNRRAEIVSLLGEGLTGAKLLIQGTIEPPGDGAAVNITVTGTHVPLDEVLFEALEDKHKQVVKMFLDRDAYERLILNKLVRVADPPGSPPSKSPIPEFELGGSISVRVVVHRPFGDDAKYTSSIHMNLAGTSLLFDRWPYPLRVQSGQLIVDADNQITVDNVVGHGLNGSLVTINGKLHTVIEDGKKELVPDLDVTASNMPIDELLLFSIPKPQDEWVRLFNLRGVVQAQGRIFRNERGEIDFAINTHIDGGRAQPFAGQYPLDNLHARMTLQRQRVVINTVKGHHGDSHVTVQGQAVFNPDKPPQIYLYIVGHDLLVEDPVLDLVPPELRETISAQPLLDQYKPRGRYHALVEYDSESTGAVPYHVEFYPLELSLDLNQQRLAFREMSGSLVINADNLSLDRLGGLYDNDSDGYIYLTGNLELGESRSAHLLIDAQANRICEITRAMLPGDIKRVLDGIELNGHYTVHGLKVNYEAPHDEPSAFRVEGRVLLDHAAANMGVAIHRLGATVDVTAHSRADMRWPWLNIAVNARQLHALDRRISPLRFRIQSDPNRADVLNIDSFDGECYGGAIVGSGEIDLNQGGRYRLALTLIDAELEPVMYPLPSALPKSHDPQPTNARVSASLTLDMIPGISASRSGRGEIQVMDANLYDTPLVVALLQIINAMLPMNRSFDRAFASYVIDGDLVRFEFVRFEAPSVELVGEGTMIYSTQDLELVFYTRRPGSGPGILGPLSELLTKMKDELVSIRVTGTLSEPKPSIEPFRGIRQSFNLIAGQNGSRGQREIVEEPSSPAQ